jgi:hypothetical protein
LYTCCLFRYAYYLLTAAGLRAMSPPLALMTAQETGLAGAFRSAHQVRLVIAACCRLAMQTTLRLLS